MRRAEAVAVLFFGLLVLTVGVALLLGPFVLIAAGALAIIVALGLEVKD